MAHLCQTIEKFWRAVGINVEKHRDSPAYSACSRICFKAGYSARYC
jgi:hypothetical protein